MRGAIAGGRTGAAGCEEREPAPEARRSPPGAALAAALVVAVLAGWAGAPARGDEALLGARQARIFQQTCARCHVRPVLAVPLLGDVDAWERLRGQGFETLVAHTIEGFGSMPPLGTCGACTEDDLRRLVAFLAGYGALPETASGGGE